MPDTEQDNIGVEGLHSLASEDFKVQSLVIGFSGAEGQTWSWLVTHSASLELDTDEGRDTILEAIEDLQKDTAMIITDAGGRPGAFAFTEPGDLSSWSEVACGFLEV